MRPEYPDTLKNQIDHSLRQSFKKLTFTYGFHMEFASIAENKIIMKKLILIAILFITIQAFSQNDKPVDSKISKVTVFLDRAQVTREVKTRIEAGRTNLVLNGLTSQLDQQSIRSREKVILLFWA